MAQTMSKWQKWKNRFTSTYYGRSQPFCSHSDVTIISVHPITLRPESGICNICKKEVKARMVWETNDV